MSTLGVFDIMGPIMVGPSSSHTAGAARLGKVARAVAGSEIEEVKFLLSGSFGKTYKGHGTDRALVAGILGMEPSDIRLRDSLQIAKEEGLKFEFIEKDIEDTHPNTVKFLIKCKNGNTCEVMGSSIGGGSIKITEVNGEKVEFTGAYPAIIINHKDIPGAVSRVTSVLYDDEVNIAFMQVFRSQKGKEATMIFEVDHAISPQVLEDIKRLDIIEKVILVNPVQEAE